MKSDEVAGTQRGWRLLLLFNTLLPYLLLLWYNIVAASSLLFICFKFVLHARSTRHVQSNFRGPFPKIDTHAEKNCSASSVIIRICVMFPTLFLTAWRKTSITTCILSYLFDMHQATGKPSPNSSTTIMVINVKLYPLVPCVSSMQTILCGPNISSI